ncbi:MAG TPA: zinc ribbon domain-containing protein [Candidatus Wallbacteria bacterium]|nr:zinc ribbon domain-containing protein [Candidatus Wallbacteria bacterium]
MPLYVYKCEKCNATIEVYMHSSKEPHPKCENCEAEMRRVLHANAVIYKTGGFYTTDYGKGKEHLARDRTGGSDSGKKS